MAEYIKLSDRVKETSESNGSGNMELAGAAPGFSPFSDYYVHNDLVFYAITDGTNYEVGSGYYYSATDDAYLQNQLRRFPIRTKGNTVTDTNNPNLGCVNFPIGVKEIYVTYPGDFSVFTAHGLDSAYKDPVSSGIAFWETDQILNYNSHLIWDSTNSRLGVAQSTPEFAIDVAGAPNIGQGFIRSSGVVVDQSGILFPSGQQHWHFMPNVTDSTTATDDAFEFDGDVEQILKFKKQNSGFVLAGPASGCTYGNGACEEGYPSFRALSKYDIPDLKDFYVRHSGEIYSSGIPYWDESGVIVYTDKLVWNDTGQNLTIDGSVDINSNVDIGGNLNVRGNVTYIDSTNVTVYDHQVELGSMSGNSLYNKSGADVDDGGIVIKTDEGDKKWTWRHYYNNGNSIYTDSWVTEESINASGYFFNDGEVNIQNFIKGYSGDSRISIGPDATSRPRYNIQAPSGGFQVVYLSGVSSSSSPADTASGLYSVSGLLYWNGGKVASEEPIVLNADGSIQDSSQSTNIVTIITGSGAGDTSFRGFGQIPTLSGMLTASSGYLNTDILSVSGNLNAASGYLNTDILSVSGIATHVSGIAYWASGEIPALDTGLQLVSGWAYWASGHAGGGGGAADITGATFSADAGSASDETGNLDLSFIGGASGSIQTSGTGGAIFFNVHPDYDASGNKNLLDASGYLYTDILSVSGVFNTGSGYLNTDILSVSGVYSTASGYLSTDILSNTADINATSGVMNRDILLITGSGDSSTSFDANGQIPTLSGMILDKAPISTTVTLTGDQDLTNKGLISPNISGSVSGDAILDEDNMASNSATKLATQQSIKAYVDSSVSAAGGGDITGATFSADAGSAVDASGDLTISFLTGASGSIQTSGAGQGLFFNIHPNYILDEDNMASNSATKLATQQSIKAYVDSQSSATEGFNIASGNVVSGVLNRDILLVTGSGLGSSSFASNGQIPTLSGVVYDASGYLNSDIQTNVANINATSGAVYEVSGVGGMLLTASGYLNTDIQTNVANINATSGAVYEVSGVGGMLLTASGYLNSDIQTASGYLHTDILSVSGNVDTASGYLNTDILSVSGVFNTGSGYLNTDILSVSGVYSTASGYMRVDIDSTSGVMRRDITMVSGVQTGSQAVSSGIRIYTTNAGQYHYIDPQWLVVVSGDPEGAATKGHEIRLGATAGVGSLSGLNGGNIFVGPFTGANSINMQYSVALGAQAASGGLDHDNAIFLGNSAGFASSGLDSSSLLGVGAGFSSSGNNNVNMIGPNAGYETSGINNGDVMGNAAAFQATNANQVVFVGREAGARTSAIEDSQYFGYKAGEGSRTSQDMFVVGDNAYSWASGSRDSVIIGSYAGHNSSGVFETIAVGINAGKLSYMTSGNVLIGENAGYGSVSSSGLIAIGRDAGYEAYAADSVIAIGQNAAHKASGMVRSIFIGYDAGQTNSPSTSNPQNATTAIGYWAGRQRGLQNTSTSHRTVEQSNLFIGTNAGSYGHGDYNVSVGYFGDAEDIINGTTSSGVLRAGYDYRFNYSNVIGGDATSTVRRVSVGAITRDPSASLHVIPNNATTTAFHIAGAAGQSNALFRTTIAATVVNNYNNVLSVIQDDSNKATSHDITEDDNNTIINSNGFLRVPILRGNGRDNDQLMPLLPSASENMGVIIMLRKDDNSVALMYSDGVRWHSTTGENLNKVTVPSDTWGEEKA